jgi:Fe-S cluster biosynthesis and repair protein YggX
MGILTRLAKESWAKWTSKESKKTAFLLDITEKSKTIGYFDKHFLYDGKNVKILGEVASEIR